MGIGGVLASQKEWEGSFLYFLEEFSIDSSLILGGTSLGPGVHHVYCLPMSSLLWYCGFTQVGKEWPTRPGL
jgi:hypothetical protein